jgi:hypothetical protein
VDFVFVGVGAVDMLRAKSSSGVPSVDGGVGGR